MEVIQPLQFFQGQKINFFLESLEFYLFVYLTFIKTVKKNIIYILHRFSNQKITLKFQYFPYFQNSPFRLYIK